MSRTALQPRPVELAGQQSFAGQPFPLALHCDNAAASLDDAVHWVVENRASLMQQTAAQGAVLLRGFPLSQAEEFDRMIAAFELENFPYERSLSNAVRVNFTPRVFSANEAPPDVTIYLHHEMAQTPIYPAMLFFACQQPAAVGGATPLCRSDVLWEQIADRFPPFAADCEAKGLRYTNVMPSSNDAASGMGRSWQSTFGSADREQVETRMRELGYSWQWTADDCLRATTPVLPAVRETADGRPVFFNQLIAAFRGWKDSRNDPAQAIKFGDGSPLDRETVLAVAALADELSFDVPWQAGDLVVVDNLLVMHGRRTFQGPRKVLASLAEPRYQG